jgi:hypothetical protein
MIAVIDQGDKSHCCDDLCQFCRQVLSGFFPRCYDTLLKNHDHDISYNNRRPLSLSTTLAQQTSGDVRMAIGYCALEKRTVVLSKVTRPACCKDEHCRCQDSGGTFSECDHLFQCEVIDSLTSRLRLHEKKLSEMLESRNVPKTEYIDEHESLINELALVNSRFVRSRHELFAFIGTII